MPRRSSTSPHTVSHYSYFSSIRWGSLILLCHVPFSSHTQRHTHTHTQHAFPHQLAHTLPHCESTRRRRGNGRTRNRGERRTGKDREGRTTKKGRRRILMCAAVKQKKRFLEVTSYPPPNIYSSFKYTCMNVEYQLL